MCYKYLYGFLFFIFHVSLQITSAQQVRINEVVASNDVLLDDERDSPDWFELYNYGTTDISLNGWTITDKFDKPKKWTFPEMSLPAGGYLPIWASGKDRKEMSFHRMLIAQGDSFRYHIPTSSVDTAWTSLAFDDTSWGQGKAGFGFSDGDDSTLVPSGTPAVFLRKKFNISSAEAVQRMVLHVDYDDAFVAYINGVEVARANMSGNPPAYNATALVDHEAQMYQGRAPGRFEIANPAAFLLDGENVLSIQAHNVSPVSSDLTIIPFLSAIYDGSVSEGKPPLALLALQDQWLHTNFKISSGGETLFIFDDTGKLVDSLTSANVPTNISIGIAADDSSRVYFDPPTPGFANTTNAYQGIITSEIIFSQEGGRVDTFSLSLSSSSPMETIRYTLDARLPNEQDSIYKTPIPIHKNTVVRARIFRENYLTSSTQTQTYLVQRTHSLPIISLVTDPYNLFDKDYGIYAYGDNYNRDLPHFGANFWEDWERPVHFSYYEPDGSLGTSFDAGIKIFGAWSRANDQRSFSIFARSQYGTDEMEYPFFKELPYENFQALILRNSGTDWLNSMIRDAVLTGLMRDSDLSVQAHKPAVTYINGEYWGFYNLREKINEHFLASKHGVNPDELDILEQGGDIVQGSNIGYYNLINFVRNNNLSPQQNYEYVTDRIDIDNYIMYNVAQVYFDNTDWPGNNVKFWKAPGGKWKWILYDTDFGFGIWDPGNFRNNTLDFALETNGPGWPNPPWATLLFRKLTQNLSFRNQFINQFADELNSRFVAGRVNQYIDSLRAQIVNEIPAHYARWGGDRSYWFNQVNNMKSFADNRPFFMKRHIQNQFNLPAFHTLTIENEIPELGYVQVNSLTIKDASWHGDYFQNVPITLTVIPTSTWTFSHWEGADVEDSTLLQIKVNMKRALLVKPRFIKQQIEVGNIIINEINYESNEAVYTDDWVELHNISSEDIDLSGWRLTGTNSFSDFVFRNGSLLEGNGYVILTKSATLFKKIHPTVSTLHGNFTFDLSNEGSTIRLIDSNGILQDEVRYLSSEPWPLPANGQGPTLELMDPSLDNSLPENWASIHTIGSPGLTNIGSNNPYFEEIKQYPNPFGDHIHIEFHAVGSTRISAVLYDLSGARVLTLFEGELPTGDHHLELNTAFLSSGIYFLRFRKGEESEQVTKWMKR